MSEAYVLFVAALLMATVLVTIACASIGRSNHARYRWLAKLCRGLGFAVLGVGSLVVGSGIILTVAPGAAPGVAELDRTQLLRNGLTEALHNVFVVCSWRSQRCSSQGARCALDSLDGRERLGNRLRRCGLSSAGQ